MKFIKIFLTSLCLIITTVANADVASQALNKVSEKISEYTIGLIPGEGYTELDINLRENNSPEFSILGVREILGFDSGNIFTQFSAFNHERFNNKSSGNINEEITINIGLGTRHLVNNNKMLVGLNAFYDIDAFATHERLSYGFEAKSAVLEFTANKYEGINSSGSEEFVLSGHDYKLSSQIPYLHWAKISATGYVWDGQDGKSDIEGSKYGTEMQLTKTFSLDVKYDDKDAEGLEDEYETNLTFNWPPKEGATALDGISSTAWNSDKDMSEELLDRVDRNNKIVVQYNGTATISRAN